MTEFLLAAAAFVLGTVVLGLVRILSGPGDTDRLLAVELLGTGGVAALLLIGVATGEPGIASLALLIALLAAFATVGFVTGAVPRDAAEPEPEHAARDPGVKDR
jgi:multicomponent Na+:H+ antiporter subunit F